MCLALRSTFLAEKIMDEEPKVDEMDEKGIFVILNK